MKRFAQLFIAAFVSLSAGLLLVTAPTALAATPKEDVCTSISAGPDCGSPSGVSLTSVIAATIKILSVVVGIAAIIMIIVSGLKYVTSGGDSGSIASAKSTLIYAIVGLIVAAFAQFLVRYVIFQSTKP